ncbi:tetratricopeptide repeat protein [Acidobacteriota bacterium]
MVWKDAEVGKYIGTEFVSLRITVNEKAYPEFSKKWGSRSTPTVMILGSDGNEIDRVVGFNKDKKDPYVRNLKDLAAGRNTLAVVQAALEKNPDGVEANWNMALKYRKRGEWRKAPVYYKRVLELDPEDTKGYREECAFMVALAEARYNDNNAPLKAFIETGTQTGFIEDAYIELTDSLDGRKDKEQIVSIYEEALAKLPESAILTYYYANSIINFRYEDLYDKALEMNGRLKSLDPGFEVDAYVNLIFYYRNIKDEVKLIETMNESLQKWPENSVFKSIYTSTVVGAGIESEYGRAAEMLEAMLKTEPEASSDWYKLAQLYEKKGELELALEAVTKALDIRPDVKVFQTKQDKLEKELQK